MSSNELVFAETSPYECLEAIIEQDDQVAYFYLRGTQTGRFDMKSCWVRNLVDAPVQLDRERLTQGLAPVLPAEFCQSPEAQAPLDEKDLRIIWFESGDGAALLEKDRIIAVIPDSTGIELVDGFSEGCRSLSPFSSPLPKKNDVLFEKIKQADRFWKSWSGDFSPWDEYEPSILQSYESRFGQIVDYVSIDGGQWPPRTIARFEWKNRLVLLTVGVSICPQPKVEQLFESPGMFRRFEIGASFPSGVSRGLLDSFVSYMGGQAQLPWRNQVFLAHGHSVSCEMFLKDDSISDFSAIILFGDSRCGGANNPQRPEVGWKLPQVMGDPVNLLWTVPVFENERRMLQETNNFGLIEGLIDKQEVPLIESRGTFI